jgi:hypothetical protein
VKRAARARVGVLIAAVTALCACTGVPRSSSPEVIQSVPVQPAQPAAVAPQPGDEPRIIVQNFLINNATNDDHHSGARAFLTPEEKNRWSDSTQTTIVDNPQVGNYLDGSVPITGHIIGTIDQTGSYTPSLPGDGSGVRGTPFSLQVGLKQVDKQWRIDTLPNGLVISSSQFSQYYQQYVVYFYDQSEQRLVPDPRYSNLTDPTQLATWLMTELVGQPQSALSTALPTIANPTQIKVVIGSTLRIELPGAGQLDSATRDRMAAQVALTLDQAAKGTPMSITDGGKPVTIPSLHTSTFTAADFSAQVNPVKPSPPLFFIRQGGVIDSNGRPLAGGLGSGAYGLRSVALKATPGTTRLLVAGESGTPTRSRLLLGTAPGSLKQTTVVGALSRPAWVPDVDEVWVGDGKTLDRVTAAGKVSAVQVTAGTGTVTGRIIAVRLSPEGARVALVVAADDGSSQVWLGTVVRSTNSVRVSGLFAISPLGIAISDVAWNDPLKLFTIGKEISSGDPSVFELYCDGSFWTSRGIGNLPQAPDTITLAPTVVAAVSAGNTVWEQQGGTWVSVTGAGTTDGTAPIYVE